VPGNPADNEYVFVIYAVAILAVLVIALLLLRIRARCLVTDGRRILFVGVGRSGQEMDFVGRKLVFRVFGLAVKTASLKKEKKLPEPKRREPTKAAPPEKGKPKRVRSKIDMAEVALYSVKPTFRYLVNLLRSLTVEQLEGRIRAGFEEPDQTGLAFGYYQAALGAVPGVVGRVAFVPVWTEASFEGEFRASVALPVYRLVFRSIQYVYRLPLRRIIKLAIGTKEGAQDVK
jgi:hypothetical protein